MATGSKAKTLSPKTLSQVAEKDGETVEAKGRGTATSSTSAPRATNRNVVQVAKLQSLATRTSLMVEAGKKNTCW